MINLMNIRYIYIFSEKSDFALLLPLYFIFVLAPNKYNISGFKKPSNWAQICSSNIKTKKER